MRTIFYKILYKEESVVYVGVTTRKITQRFMEHLKSKGLNPSEYTIVEFYGIIHPEISSLEVFYKERKRVADLERKYINEELNKGSKLLNLSEGGEWGTNILNKLRKEKFLEKFGSYDGYKEYKKKKGKVRVWLQQWSLNKSRNKVKAWINNWIKRKSENKTKVWLRDWIKCRSENKTKVWVKSWVYVRSRNKTKAWIKNWMTVRGKSKTKAWTENWINHKSENNVKRWMKNWVRHRSENKSKVWLNRWITNKSINKIKAWLWNWIQHRKIVR